MAFNCNTFFIFSNQGFDMDSYILWPMGSCSKLSRDTNYYRIPSATLNFVIFFGFKFNFFIRG